MAYQKQNFAKGDTLKAAQLNTIEDGIVQIEEAIEDKADLDESGKLKEEQLPETALTDEELTEAINTALTEAKESGAFDGVDGKDGKDGYTPIKGTDYFTEADKAEMVALVIENLGGNPVFGYVDENNNILVQGDLADGSYSVKYEMEDGSTVDIGNLVLDSNVYYSVTNNLTNCINGNSETEVIEGNSYSAVISANDGYELSSLVVTMGGTDITSSAVSGGNINIVNVTGNIVITAVAEEIKVSYTNLADPSSADWWANSYLGSDGTVRTQDGYGVSNYIGPVNVGDIIYIKGLDLTGTGAQYRSCPYKTDKSIHGSFGCSTLTALGGLPTPPITDVAVTTTGGQFTHNNSDVIYWRIGGLLNGSANDVIITINEPIE